MDGFRTTLRLALLAALAALALYITDLRLRDRREAGQARDLPRGLSEAESFDISYSNGVHRTFRHDGPSWRIVHPYSALAENSKVQLLLDAIEASSRLQRIPEREINLRGLSMSDFGLDPAQATIAITGRHGTLRTISFGVAPPASTNEIFASIDGEDGVSILDTRIMECLLRPLEDFSDRRLCRVNILDVNRITVERPDEEPMRIRRAADRDAWRITSPAAIPADWGEMQKFLDAIAQARIDTFLYGPSAMKLSEAAFTVKLYSEKSPFPAIISVGAPLPDGTVRAISDNGGPVAISAETAAALDVSPATLRDRRVFASGPTLDVASLSISADGVPPLVLEREAEGDWKIASPAEAKADQDTVSKIVDELLSLKAESYSPPPTNGLALAVEIATPGATNRLDCVFSPSGLPDSKVAVTLDGADSAAMADDSSLDTLRRVAACPGLAASRHIGGYALRDILSIEVARADGSNQRFDLAPDGSMSIGGDDADTEPISNTEEISARISAMARFLASIDADSVLPEIGPPAEGLSALGLETPFLSVTVEPRNPGEDVVSIAFSAPPADQDGTVLACTGDSGAIYVFPATACEIFARNFRESYHAAEPAAK